MKKGDKFQTDFIVDDEIYNGFIDLFKFQDVESNTGESSRGG